MTQQPLVRRDTSAWIFQVWASFAIALLFCGYGIWNLPNGVRERVFLATGFFFCLSSTFVLAKCIRDNQYEQVDTPIWRAQVWAAFVIAALLTAWGLHWMEIKEGDKAYMMVSWLFLISTTFTLTKTQRDAFEADKLEKSLEKGAQPAAYVVPLKPSLSKEEKAG